MPCSDSSSSLAFKVDHNEKFLSFDYAKITCGREITGGTGLDTYLKGMPIADILETSFEKIKKDLKVTEEETHFILYLEWEALRAAIAQYLGITSEAYDADRCSITSIDHDHQGIEVALVILPPQEMPKILPCSLGD